MAFSLVDVDFLIDNADAIAEVAASGRVALTKKSQIQDAQYLRERFGEHGRAVHELLGARATGKLPAHWIVDSDAAQQATPQAVASFRAWELVESGVRRVIDVTCSVGTEGGAATEPTLNPGLEYFGFDVDPARVRMARHNVPRGHFALGDALQPAFRASRQDDVIIADPARRAGGRRIARPEDLVPPLPDLIDAHAGRNMVIKCAPGLDYSFWDGGVTVTSVRSGGGGHSGDGQAGGGQSTRPGVKEVSLYTPDLSTARRAVMLAADGGVVDIVTRGGTNGDAGEPGAITGEPGKFIIDPDGAIVRAGLVRDYAAREGLWQLDERIAYLSGDRIPEGASGFPFIEAVPVKKVKSALARLDAGSVEIVVRGLDIDPDAFRKKLKLKGSTRRAVVLTRIGKAGVGLICDRRVWDYDEPVSSN